MTQGWGLINLKRTGTGRPNKGTRGGETRDKGNTGLTHGEQGADQSILQCLTSYTCKFTHLFNIIFSDLRLAKSNIISADVDNNLTEFTFSISQHF